MSFLEMTSGFPWGKEAIAQPLLASELMHEPPSGACKAYKTK